MDRIVSKYANEKENTGFKLKTFKVDKKMELFTVDVTIHQHGFIQHKYRGKTLEIEVDISNKNGNNFSQVCFPKKENNVEKIVEYCETSSLLRVSYFRYFVVIIGTLWKVFFQCTQRFLENFTFSYGKVHVQKNVYIVVEKQLFTFL